MEQSDIWRVGFGKGTTMAKLIALFSLLLFSIVLVSVWPNQSWTSVSMLLLLISVFGIVFSTLSGLKHLNR